MAKVIKISALSCAPLMIQSVSDYQKRETTDYVLHLIK